MFDEFQKFIIGQKAILIRNGKCLIMEDAGHPGLWEMPGGRIDKEEDARSAFLRELKEELGIDSFKNLGVVDFEIFYPKKFPFCLIANLIENESDEIKVSSEHLGLAWISEEEIDKYEFKWPFIGRMLKNGFKFHKLLNDRK